MTIVWHLLGEGLAYVEPGTSACCGFKIEALPDDDMMVHSWEDVPEGAVQCRNHHVLSEPEKLAYPGGKDGFYVVRCTCGYKTSPNGIARRAEKAAEAHERAKEIRDGR